MSVTVEINPQVDSLEDWEWEPKLEDGTPDFVLYVLDNGTVSTLSILGIEPVGSMGECTYCGSMKTGFLSSVNGVVCFKCDNLVRWIHR